MKQSRGFLGNNPIAVMMVGLCPAAAVTGRVIDALWMSLGVFFVLVLTRLGQGILRGLGQTPPGPPSTPPALAFRCGLLGGLFLASCFTASFELILLAFAPEEGASLGIYVPLIAVNCIVLDRVLEPGTPDDPGTGKGILRSLQTAAAIGAGFALCLVVISLVREILGSGTITLFPMRSFGGTIEVGGLSRAPARALISAGGGFLCLGYLAGAARLLSRSKRQGEANGGEEEAKRA